MNALKVAVGALLSSVITFACSRASDDSAIEHAIRASLSKKVHPYVVNNALGGTNGQLEEFEILSKEHNKGEPNPVFKAFGAKPQPYWSVDVHIKGTADIGFDSQTAVMLGGGAPEPTSFDSRTT